MSSVIKTLFSKKEEEAAAPAAGTSMTPLHVTDDTFQDVVLNAQVPALLDFWAPWCGPCRMVAPIVEELAESYGERLVVAKINTDENIQVASDYGILGIPTLILFKGGEEVDRIVGFVPKQNLKKRLDAVLDGGAA